MAGRLVSVRTDTRNEINAERLSNIYIYTIYPDPTTPQPAHALHWMWLAHNTGNLLSGLLEIFRGQPTPTNAPMFQA